MAAESNVYDIIIVGSGVAGITAAYRIQTQLPASTSYVILEARDSIGGTWDFFKYPGLRSDSDLHTFGFPFRPWTQEKDLGDGKTILKYIKDTAAEYGIDQHVKFRHKCASANWSSKTQSWTLDIEQEGITRKFKCSFLFMATGYYDYDTALQTTIPGIENFQGCVIHPQFWPEDLNYSGKKVVIIGSGATAVTILPVLAKNASHVVMLQRSPTYILPLPSSNPLDNLARTYLPQSIALSIIRWRFIIMSYLFYLFCRTFPIAARNVIRKSTLEQLPSTVSHDKHFNPTYNPWEQRLCFCPEGDFFEALRDGHASVVTGHIKSMSGHSIELASGEQVEDVDIIVTATGLKLRFTGGVKLSVDDVPVHIGTKFLWKGTLIQDVPNAAIALGYTNASWTLGADVAAQLVTRLIRHMRSRNISSAVPRTEEGNQLQKTPLFDLNSTYLNKAKDEMPKVGDQGPWRVKKRYMTDIWDAKFGDLTTGLEFTRG